MKNLVSKEINEKIEKTCYFFLDVMRTIQPNLIKPTEAMINVISSRFNFNNMGKIKTKNLNEYVSKLWK